MSLESFVSKVINYIECEPIYLSNLLSVNGCRVEAMSPINDSHNRWLLLLQMPDNGIHK